MGTDYRSFSQYLRGLSVQYPDKPFLGDCSGWFTTDEVYKKIHSLSLQLIACGVRQGDNIALRTERNADTLLLLFALRNIGAITLLADPHYEPEHFIGECSDSIPFHGTVCRQSRGCFLLRRGTEIYSLLTDKETNDTEATLPEVDGNGPAFIIFTSGTTGKNKAVVLSDFNLINNLRFSQPGGDYRSDDIALGAIPFDHVFGLALVTGMLVHGYSMYIPENTDPDSLLKAITREKITRMNGVPSLYFAMAERSPNCRPTTLRVGFIGGAPAGETQFSFIEESLGITLVPVYGMSECIGISLGDYREPRSLRATTVGKPYICNMVRILSDTGLEVLPGQEGEICVNGPFKMLGYRFRPLLSDEFLHTGDLGYMNSDGYLVISGRKKDLIIRNGKNISPKKIEDALLSIPGVRTASVVGLPDEKAGEVPYAMVVGIVDPSELKSLLPKNELPVAIMCVESLPMTSSGKPDKQKIREVLNAWKNG